MAKPAPATSLQQFADALADVVFQAAQERRRRSLDVFALERIYLATWLARYVR